VVRRGVRGGWKVLRITQKTAFAGHHLLKLGRGKERRQRKAEKLSKKPLQSGSERKRGEKGTFTIHLNSGAMTGCSETPRGPQKERESQRRGKNGLEDGGGRANETHKAQSGDEYAKKKAVKKKNQLAPRLVAKIKNKKGQARHGGE